MQRLSNELRLRRYDPPQETCNWLGRVLRGFDQYFGVPTNETVLERMRRHIQLGLGLSARAPSQRARWTVPMLERFKRFPLPEVADHPSMAPGTLCCLLIQRPSPLREIRSPGSAWGQRESAVPTETTSTLLWHESGAP